MKAPLRIALVGDDPGVFAELARALIERGFDRSGIRVLGSKARYGDVVEVDDVDLRFEQADSLGLAGSDAVMFFGSEPWVRDFVDLVPDGALALDATGGAAFQTDTVPIVPEVNAERIGALAARGTLVLPEPASVGLAVALAPLHEAARVRRVVTTVLDSASGAGVEGIERLSRQSVRLMQGQGLDDDPDDERLAFNLRPGRGEEGSAWSSRERRIAAEVAAVLEAPDLDVVATEVRVPVFHGLAQAVWIETEEPLGADEAEQALVRGRGLLVAGTVAGAEVASPGSLDVAGSDAVHVGRVRADPRNERALAFWLCLDGQRKGVALNAVATLEVALRDRAGA